MQIKQVFAGKFKYVFLILIALFALIDWIVFSQVQKNEKKIWQQTPNVSQKLSDKKLKPGKYVVLFYQKGCVYCQKAMPLVQKEKKLASKHHVKFFQVNTQTKSGRALASDYTIESTPTLLLMDKAGDEDVKLAPVSITYDKEKQGKKIDKNLIGVKTKTIKNAMKGRWSWVNSY